MKVKNISYPHPVLGNEDDVQGAFNVKFFHGLGRDKISLRIKFELKNKTLESLIKEKKAFFAVEIECNSTFYRGAFSTFSQEGNFAINAQKLREHVLAKFFIRAAEPIKNYSIDGCHDDYKGFSFDINKGDVLAIGGATSFIAEKEFDPLKPAVSSFMAIRKGNEPKGPMVVDYGDPEKIIVKLSRNDWEKYQNIKGRQWVAPVLHSSIVLPVLADAVRLVHDNDEDARDTHWFKRLETILEQKNLPMDMPLDAAQHILSAPVSRSLGSIEGFSLDNE